MEKYNPQEIEPKWQAIWEKTGLYRAVDGDASRPKYYYLFEFPYPSGEGLHVGHLRPYTALDIMARHKRMQGFNVLFPMGWDAFGLPTENFAIKHQIAPQIATERNIKNIKRQVQDMGYSIDWSREINTTDPSYYKWTQWIFLQLYKAGLAYQAEIAINWCPKCKTGLANEEVAGGRHERCDTPVEKKLLNQWLLKITAYADRLIEDLKTVDYLPRVATQQVNWIGRSEGALITFNVKSQKSKVKSQIEVFTTRPDTLGGATFLVLAPEHPLVSQLTTKEQKAEVEAYIKKVQSESELERQETNRPKTGVWTGAMAINPLSNQEIPIWIADYVLMGYGTGAIMAVPAHDERDFEFAQKFELPIKPVIEPVTGTPHGDDFEREAIVAVVRNPETSETLMLDWGPRRSNWGGMLFIGGGVEAGEDVVKAAEREIAEETGYIDVKFLCQAEVPVNNYYFSNVKRRHDKARMRGLLFELQSDKRQDQSLDAGERDKFSVKWLPDDQVLSTVSDDGHELIYRLLTSSVVYTGEGPLVNSGKYDGLEGRAATNAIIEDLSRQGQAKHTVKYKLRDWVFSRQHYWGEPIPVVHCSKCGVVAVPENQLPVELPAVEHYQPTDTGESPLAAMTDWVNTTCPQCDGPARRETDTMPNWAGSSWYYLRYIDPDNDQAFAGADKLKYWLPVDLYNGGMEHTTLHLLYSRFWHKFMYDQKLVPTPEPYAQRRSHEMILGPDNQKMSKSRGNVINPDAIVGSYGADVLRLYEMFMGPFDETTSWSDERLAGVYRFVNRVWGLAQKLMDSQTSNVTHSTSSGQERQASGTAGAVEAAIDRMTHKTLKKVHEDIAAMRFNTMVSALMEYVNFLHQPDAQQAVTGNSQLAERTVRHLVLMLAPAAPHLAEELWSQLGEAESVHVAAWPQYDPELIKEDLVEIILQVNGKLRGTMTMPVAADEQQLEETAKTQEAIQRYLDGKKIVKTIVVPRKLVNFVVR